MTVSTTANRITYAGNGSTTAFAFPYKFIATTDLIVYVGGILQTSGYTVGTPTDSGANVTFSAAPANGASIVIISSPSQLQSTSLPSTGPFPAKSVETMADKLTLLVQRLGDLVSRSLTLSDADTSTASTTLPSPVSNKLIGWNGTATGLQNIDMSTLATIVAYGTANSDIFTGTGSQTAFVLSANPAALNNLDVAVGGVTQLPGTDYTWISGTTVTFTTAPPSGAKVLIRYMQALALGTADAGSVKYTPAGTGAAATTVQTKLRESVSVKDFGAKGDGVTDDSAAFAAACTYITSVNGGTLLIPPGTYIVYTELFAGSAGLGYAYKNITPAINFGNVTGAIQVIGYGATIKWKNGYHVGSFNATTGASYSPSLPYYGENAGIPGNMVYLYNCSHVIIRGLTLDGNIQNAIVGGQWGDSGYQMSANGINIGSVDMCSIENVKVKNFPTDGIVINNNIYDSNNSITMLKSDVETPVTLTNVICDYNGRQGLTILSSSGVVAINCKFRYSSRALNGIAQFINAPGAGVDIETDPGTSQLTKNAKFINCEFSFNNGVGALVSYAGNGDGAVNSEPIERISFDLCTFIGQYASAASFNMPNIYATDCLFVGMVTSNNGSTVGANWPAYFANMYFLRCRFTDYSEFSPDNNNIYRSATGLLAFQCSGIPKVYLTECTVDALVSAWGDLRGCVINSTVFVIEGASLAASSLIVNFDAAYLNNVTLRDNLGVSGRNYYFYVTSNTRIASKITIVSSNGNIVGPGYGSISEGKYAANDVNLSRLRLTSYIDDARTPTNSVGYAAAAPTTGTWVRGDMVFNNAPATGSPKGWTCTVSGSPGTWVSQGNL